MPITLPYSDPNGTPYVSQSSSRSFESSVLTARFDDGYEAVIPSGINSYRQYWNLRFSNISMAEASTVLAAFEQVGSWDIVNWIPFGESQNKKFRVVAGSVKQSYNGDRTSIEFMLRQVF